MRALAIFMAKLSFLLLTSELVASAATPPSALLGAIFGSDPSRTNLFRRQGVVNATTNVQEHKTHANTSALYTDEHAYSHSHHSAPLLELNETLVLKWHLPTPPSYGTHDFEDPEVEKKYPGIMALHALLMSFAFFVALPVGKWCDLVNATM